MAKTTLSEKQTEKLRDSDFARSNSSDLTINPSYQDEIEYDDEGNLIYDKRTRTGKEIDRILKSRKRSSKKDEEMDDDEDDEWDEDDEESEDDDEDDEWAEDDEESEDDDDDFDAYSEIKNLLSRTELKGEVDTFYSLWESWWEEDQRKNGVDDERDSFNLFSSNIIDSACDCIDEGNTVAFAVEFARRNQEGEDDSENGVFNALSYSERQEDAESWASKNLDELNRASIDYFLEIVVNSDDFSDSVNTAREFDEEFKKAIDAGKGEDTAEKYARWRLDGEADFPPPTGDNPTTKSLSDLSDENFEEEFEKWLEEKYDITVLDISGSTVRYEYEDLVFEREFDFNSEDWCDDGPIDILLS